MERPILFSGPMVRAILDGRKTQTRRVVKPQPGGQLFHGMDWRWYRSALADEREPIRCPYGVPGDRLWVRETFALSVVDPDGPPPEDDHENYDVIYRADPDQPGGGWTDGDGKAIPPPWRPSIHMPRWASRLTLEVVSVRVERLNEISEADARAEGMDADVANSPRVWFMATWNAINAKRAPWESNPWVWRVEFRRVE